MAARQQIPYGIVDFKRIRDEGYYYVDKTAYIRKMEARDSFVFFVRPRRMGKSLFVDTLRCYYDMNEKANFSRLFGDLDIGLNPTENANRYLVLTLDFSQVEFMAGETLEEKFSRYLASRMAGFVEKYRAFLPGLPAAFPMRGGADMFEAVVSCAGRETPIYLILDEYDNFTNTLLRGGGSEPYRAVTHGTGFCRSWFKAFKASCARIQGYMQAEFGHLKFFLMAPEMETARGFCDFALFPERVHYGDAAHSYLIELKYAAKDAADAVLDAQCAEAKAQLARCRADRFVPALARGTTLHQIVFQFKGAALHRLEQISEEAL